MFREMRRKKQQLSDNECVDLLKEKTSGVLSVMGDDGYPYGVPISYVYHEERIYFHSALSGHKIDAISRYDKASFTVIGQDEIVSAQFTTYFRSVIAFGRVQILEGEAEKLKAVSMIADRYSPGADPESRQKEIAHGFNHAHVLEFTIENMTGKEAIELRRRSTESGDAKLNAASMK